MVRRNEFVGIVVVATVCLLLIAYSQKEDDEEIVRYRRPLLSYETDFNEDSPEEYPNSSSVTIKDVVRIQGNRIEKSLSDYEFSAGLGLENLTMSSGGQPVRIVIITTWRSGSTFLGEVINSIPGNYYHYEPLLDYGIIQIRGPPYSDTALSNLKNLLNCDYTNLQNYLGYGKQHVYLFSHNTRLWNLCGMYPQFCWNSTFLSSVCKTFPFQSMKTVRLRLRLAEQLLNDQTLNVKIVLLVRDPRGILQSRKHRDWCPGEPDCDKPNLLCADMVSDYSAAIRLKKSYPDRFRAIRYEDLSLNPYSHVRDLFKFFGLFFHKSVKEFLDSHTKMDVGGVSSTFRDSKSAPFHWKMDLNFSEVQYIEENCDQAMKLWGYVKARDESTLRDFNPVSNYTIS